MADDEIARVPEARMSKLPIRLMPEPLPQVRLDVTWRGRKYGHQRGLSPELATHYAMDKVWSFQEWTALPPIGEVAW
jgi:hypothetical protein